jgi:hypothetical protein
MKRMLPVLIPVNYFSKKLPSDNTTDKKARKEGIVIHQDITALSK